MNDKATTGEDTKIKANDKASSNCKGSKSTVPAAKKVKTNGPANVSPAGKTSAHLQVSLRAATGPGGLIRTQKLKEILTDPLNVRANSNSEDREEGVDGGQTVGKAKPTTNRPDKRVLFKTPDYCISLLASRYKFFISAYNPSGIPGFPRILPSKPIAPLKPTTNPEIVLIACGQVDDTYALKKRGKDNTQQVDMPRLEAFIRLNVAKGGHSFVDMGG